MLLLGLLVLVGWLLAALPFVQIEHARGDCEHRMDERDLDVPVPLTALDERQGGQGPFGVGEVLSRGAGCLWCALHGPDLVSGQGPGSVFTAPAGAAWVAPWKFCHVAVTPTNP